MEFHPFANLFPMMQGDAFDALKADIAEHGVREPIVFLGGKILDGRNRYQCARELGLDFLTVEFAGDDPLAFVISHNLHRRHLTESQRAMVAAKLAKMRVGDNQHAQICAPSQSNAAEMLSVSRRAVQTAKKVERQGSPVLVDAVERGEVSVSAAADVSELPPETQVEVVANGTARQAAKEIREKRRPIVLENTGKAEWYTPERILEAARSVDGPFDFDPASSPEANEKVQAAQIFTAEDDGLALDWPLGHTWMNPPYSAQLVGAFSSRFCEHVAAGGTGFVLTNNATETGWFQELLTACSAVCFHKGRIRFVCPDKGGDGTPLQGQAIFYFGANVSGFQRVFGELGVVLCRQP